MNRYALPRPFRPVPLRFGLVLALFLTFGLGCAPSPEIAQEADFRLPTIGGEMVGPPDFLGQAVVVDFWATWCTPCRLQADILDKAHAELASQGVRFLAVNVGEDEKRVGEFLERHPMPYPCVLDGDEKVSSELGVLALPTVMVIGADGQVRYFESGLLTGDKLRELVS